MQAERLLVVSYTCVYSMVVGRYSQEKHYFRYIPVLEMEAEGNLAEMVELLKWEKTDLEWTLTMNHLCYSKSHFQLMAAGEVAWSVEERRSIPRILLVVERQ